MPKSIMDAKFVFVRRDAHMAPLRQPYDGPFEVVRAGTKTFVLQKGDRQETVTIDHLKKAYVDTSEQLPLTIPPKRGRPRKPQEYASGLPEVVTKTLPDKSLVIPPKVRRPLRSTPSVLPDLAKRTLNEEKVLIEDQRSRFGRVLRLMKKYEIYTFGF